MKKPSVAKLKKEADKFYSIKLRTSSADSRGFVGCYTCGIRKHWKFMQCGHYESRSNNATRFDPKNTKIQCVGCNIFKSGHKTVFAINLAKEYGAGILKELRKKAQGVKQFSIKELQEMIKEYKNGTNN